MNPHSRALNRLCCIGEVMIELTNRPGHGPILGVAGDTYNTAVYLQRLLRGTDKTTTYVTALGTDPYSQKILAALEDHNLDTSFIEIREDKIPGLYAIDTDAQGERSFTYWRSDSAARTLFVEPCALAMNQLENFDLIYLSGITMAILQPEVRERLIRFIEGYRRQGGIFAYDSNYRPRLWANRETAQQVNAQMWRLADIALPSVDDEMALFGDADETAVLARLKDLGVTAGALKRGAAGPLDLSGQSRAEGLALVDKVVDSTAAGDSFNAGFLAAIALGKGPKAAMETGHNLAARVIAVPGAIIPE